MGVCVTPEAYLIEKQSEVWVRALKPSGVQVGDQVHECIQKVLKRKGAHQRVYCTETFQADATFNPPDGHEVIRVNGGCD